MNIQRPRRLHNIDSDAVLQEAVDRIATANKLSTARRNFLRGSLTLGGLAMLSGCMLDDSESVNTALSRISRINDDVQGLLFDPNRLAPTYPDSMITRPFPFNAYYGEDEVREVEEESYRLEVAGLVADRRKWSLPELRAMPQADQVTRHICVEGWSAIGKWGGVPFFHFLRKIGADTTAKYVGFKCADDYFTSIEHGHRPAPADPAGVDLRRPGAAAQIRVSDEAAHAHQARLQEPQTHPGDFCHQHLPWRLLGRPGLQLVRR